MKFRVDNIQKKIVLYIIVITVPMFLISLFLIQKYVSSELVRSEYRQAMLINTNTLKNIEDFLDETSNFTIEAAYMIKADPERYKEVLPFLKEQLSADSSLFGSALAIDPARKLYCKYFYRGTDSVQEKWLMPPDYDYSRFAWFTVPKTSRKPHWSEPYFDKGGGEVYMSTFSFPVIDKQGDFWGVVTADVELDVLSEYIQRLNKGNPGKLFLVSKKGLLLSHPDTAYSQKKSIYDYAISIDSKELELAAKDMEKGKSGIYSISLPDGDYTLYTMYVNRTSWSIGILMKNSLLFKPLDKLKIKLWLIMLVDILLIMGMVLIVSNQLKSNAAKEEKARHELELANKIQQHFLPEKSSLRNELFELSGLMIPAKEVGGDFYGYRQKGDQLMFYVGDVSGKGVPASLFMMAVQMMMDSLMDEDIGPAEILTKVNEKILKISTTGMFATMIVGSVDLKSRKLTYSVAGHPPFVIKSGEGIFSPIPAFALPIAAFEGITYSEKSIPLQKDAVIITFSDGVSEAENARLDMYGTTRVGRILETIGDDDSADAIKERLLRDIRKFTNGHEQNDDLTIVVVRLS